MSFVRSLAALALAAALAAPAHAFCGFYVASGEAKLFNKASQVVLVRDGDRTVITMASDFKGDVREFALVVPVPSVIRRGQVHVAESDALARLDQFSAPRLVEYFDENPCTARIAERSLMSAPSAVGAAKARREDMSSDARVRIEASYTVGEYDILVLSATESTALASWLRDHHYRVPAGAARVLDAYLKQGMKFFVAKVNLTEQARLGFSKLRPIQIAYEHAKFMLPIRLGMANAEGAQELFVYAITKSGRVETTNYRNVKLPTGENVPAFVKESFAPFYTDLFGHQQRRQGMGVVFTEYAWDMTWCDPCAAPPLSPAELKAAGVWWAGESGAGVFLTRLHARYDRESFPEDLVLQVTNDRENFQGRWVIRHEWAGESDCDAARAYRRTLPGRRLEEARNLSALTGWRLERVLARMGVDDEGRRPGEAVAVAESPWWEKLWK